MQVAILDRVLVQVLAQVHQVQVVGGQRRARNRPRLIVPLAHPVLRPIKRQARVLTVR